MRRGLGKTIEATSRLAQWHSTFLCSELAKITLHSFGNFLCLLTNVLDRDWLRARHCDGQGGRLLRESLQLQDRAATPRGPCGPPGPQCVLLMGVLRGREVKKPWPSVSKLVKRFYTKSRNKTESPEQLRPQIIRSIIITPNSLQRQGYAIPQDGWLPTPTPTEPASTCGPFVRGTTNQNHSFLTPFGISN